MEEWSRADTSEHVKKRLGPRPPVAEGSSTLWNLEVGFAETENTAVTADQPVTVQRRGNSY